MTSALILGDAASLWADAEAAQKLFTPDLVAACNNSGLAWKGHVDHWFTLHPNKCVDWIGIELARQRRVREGRNDPVTWAHKPAKGIDRALDDWQGSTGLLAVKGMLLELKCDRIVLAGIPMSKLGAHFYDQHVWQQAERYHRGWEKHLDEIAPYVRSMSGWTRELLGAPTTTWLAK